MGAQCATMPSTADFEDTDIHVNIIENLDFPNSFIQERRVEFLPPIENVSPVHCGIGQLSSEPFLVETISGMSGFDDRSGMGSNIQDLQSEEVVHGYPMSSTLPSQHHHSFESFEINPAGNAPTRPSTADCINDYARGRIDEYTFVTEMNRRHKWMIFSMDKCSFCRKAKAVLDGKGISYGTVDIDIVMPGKKKMLLNYFKETTGAGTVPRIFLNSSLIGGYDDLMAREKRENQRGRNQYWSHGPRRHRTSPLLSSHELL